MLLRIYNAGFLGNRYVREKGSVEKQPRSLKILRPTNAGSSSEGSNWSSLETASGEDYTY